METLAVLVGLGLSIWALVHISSKAKKERRIRREEEAKERQRKAKENQRKAEERASQETSRLLGATSSSEKYQSVLEEERAREVARYQLEMENIYKQHPKLRDRIPTYGFWAFLSLGFFLPFAFVAMLYSSATKQHLKRGDTLLALKASLKTRYWIYMAIATGILLILLIVKYSK